MTQDVLGFYEAFADHYHLIFEDWDRAIERQARVLGPLLTAQLPHHPLTILDCSCGIGTQAIAFATLGHQVVASDLSPAAIRRAQKEAQSRALNISFHVSDMTALTEISQSDFDVVATLDNALPHLTPIQLKQSIHAIASKLRHGGLLLASIRDYDALQHERQILQLPAFYGEEGDRRIVHQLWEWIADDRYIVHLYLTIQSGQSWNVHHFASEYRCVLRNEISMSLHSAGFNNIQWIMPPESGFYQPIVFASLSERATRRAVSSNLAETNELHAAPTIQENPCKSMT